VAEIKEIKLLDLQKFKEILFFVLKIVSLIALAFWFFGVVDEPQFVGNEVGFVTGCSQKISRSGHNGDIYCGATLKNGDSATFKSQQYISENEQVVFAHYRGKLTGRNSYIAGN
jgi:hypothetical protein